MVRLQPSKVTIPETEEERNSQSDSERWCIIGAGFAGLTMAASLQQRGIPFVVYEKHDRIGGNWDQGTYTGVHTISSKKITEISDFPMPQDYPDFPSAEQVLRYLNNYADHFKIREHIKFQTEVQKIQPIMDGCQWKVTISTRETPIRYKGVIICIGHDWDPNIPTYPGKPSMECIHSRYYKNAEILKNKKVLTIGGGNSATDIACDAARFAKFSAMSLRRGYWFVPRMLFGKPSFEVLPHWIPAWVQELYLRFGFRCMYGKLSDYGLPQPKYSLFDHPLSITDQIFHDIRKGRLHIYPEVKSIDGNTVTFVDGRKEDFDLVIFATGYRTSFPMASHLIKYKEGVAQLVHGVVHPMLKHFYVLGFGFARSGAGPLLCAAAKTIARSIRTQDKIKVPIGRILLGTGSRIPQKGKQSKDIIIDPYKAFGKEFIGKRMLLTVPFFENLFFKPKEYNPKRYGAHIRKVFHLDDENVE